METKESAARLDPQFTQCIQTLKAWETVYKKKHPDANQLIATHALEESDDKKAKEWLEAYNKKLDAEFIEEARKHAHAMSASIWEMLRVFPSRIIHGSDKWVATYKAWGAAVNLFMKEGKLCQFQDIMHSGQELLNMGGLPITPMYICDFPH